MDSQHPDLPPNPPRDRLWVIWLLFFFQTGSIGVYYTFINVYFQQAGLTGTQLGLVSMTGFLATVLCSPVWGYLSDRLNRPRRMIFTGAAGALLLFQLIPFVPPGAYRFWIYVGLIGLVGAFYASPSTLIDSTALLMLGPRREEYGRYRLGGSIGYIILTALSGLLFQRLGLGLMFPLYGAIMGGLALATRLLPRLAKPGPDAPEPPPAAGGGLRAVLDMLRQPSYLVLVVCLFLVWIALNGTVMFLGVTLSGLGASSSLIGMATTMQAVLEIPLMLLSGPLLRRFGPKRLIVVAMLILALRGFLFAWMPAPEWALGINLLNGPGFVLIWTSAVTYANRMAPPGRAGTAQSLIMAATSLASVVSALLTGWLLDVLGHHGMFAVLGCLVLAGLAVFVLGDRAG